MIVYLGLRCKFITDCNCLQSKLLTKINISGLIIFLWFFLGYIFLKKSPTRYFFLLFKYLIIRLLKTLELKCSINNFLLFNKKKLHKLLISFLSRSFFANTFYIHSIYTMYALSMPLVCLRYGGTILRFGIWNDDIVEACYILLSSRYIFNTRAGRNCIKNTRSDGAVDWAFCSSKFSIQF